MVMWPASTRTVIGEAAIRLEKVGVAFVAAEAEAGGDVEGHLVAAMGDAAGGRPAGDAERVERAEVFAKAVGEGAVELQPVAVGTEAAVAEQVSCILVAE